MSAAGFWSPAWRSRPKGHKHLKVVRFLLIGLATLVLPSLTMQILSVPFGMLTDASREALKSVPTDSIVAGIATVMLLTVFAPLYGLVLVPVGMALFVIAMRFGTAGWGVAGVASLVFAGILGNLFRTAGAEGGTVFLFMGFMVPIVLFHAAVLWGLTRWLLPETLLPAPE